MKRPLKNMNMEVLEIVCAALDQLKDASIIQKRKANVEIQHKCVCWHHKPLAKFRWSH